MEQVEPLLGSPTNKRPMRDHPRQRTDHNEVTPAATSGHSTDSIGQNKEYANQNYMKLNYKKTKIMVFNPCRSIDFMPEVTIDDHHLEVVDEIRLLGLIIRSDMKWVSNTANMVQKANKRLWILRRLKNLGAKDSDLVDIFIKQIRSVLELAVPAWQGGISQAEKQDLERIQKCACHIILGTEYQSYRSALKTLNLETLETRRIKLTMKFGLKSEKHKKFQKWFKPTPVKVYDTRIEQLRYCNVKAKHTRFAKSPLSYLTSLLNKYYVNKK